MSAELDRLDIPDWLDEEPRVLAVVNPGSANYKRASEQVRGYRDAGYMQWTDVVSTDRDPLLTQEKLHEKLSNRGSKYNVIACLTGDGGANPVAHYLIENDASQPLYLGGFGTINDGHYITVGKQEQGLLAGQPIKAIYPIEVNITSPAGETDRSYALFYASLGFTAVAAAAINSEGYRRNPWHKLPLPKKPLQAYYVGKAVFDSQPFMIRDEGSDELRAVHEYLLMKGTRMAGMPIYDADPTKRSIRKLEIASKLGIFGKLGQIAIGNYSGWQDTEYEFFVVHNVDDSDTRSATVMQMDGEDIALSNGSKIEIRPAPPLRVLAPALEKNRAYT